MQGTSLTPIHTVSRAAVARHSPGGTAEGAHRGAGKLRVSSGSAACTVTHGTPPSISTPGHGGPHLFCKDMVVLEETCFPFIIIVLSDK